MDRIHWVGVMGVGTAAYQAALWEEEAHRVEGHPESCLVDVEVGQEDPAGFRWFPLSYLVVGQWSNLPFHGQAPHLHPRMVAHRWVP